MQIIDKYYLLLYLEMLSQTIYVQFHKIPGLLGFTQNVLNIVHRIVLCQKTYCRLIGIMF